jgi:hypothetical protein
MEDALFSFEGMDREVFFATHELDIASHPSSQAKAGPGCGACSLKTA